MDVVKILALGLMAAAACSSLYASDNDINEQPKTTGSATHSTAAIGKKREIPKATRGGFSQRGDSTQRPETRSQETNEPIKNCPFSKTRE